MSIHTDTVHNIANIAELYPLRRRATLSLRWATIGLSLLLTLVEPGLGRTNIPNWGLVLLFALYSLLVDLISGKLLGHVSLARRVVVDLPVAALAYFLGAQPGSPLFLLVFLSVIYAALSMSLPSSLFYTMAAAALTIAIEPTLPLWQTTAENIRELGTRVAVLLIAGVGAAALGRSLAAEQVAAASAYFDAGRLRERDGLRGTLMSTISHELRIPFTAIRAGLGLIEASAADRLRPDERQLLAEARSSTDRLGIRINDLLAFNQLVADELRLEREPCDLRAVITDAIAVIHPLIIQKKQTLEVDVPDPLLVIGDPRRLEQVMVNVIDNAHQHTRAGTRIRISGRRNPSEILLAVSDTGPGIPLEEQQAIFERFHSHDTQAGGWGIGLAIARVIVELHGGRIWVESQPEHGATFYISLPKPDERDAAAGGAT